MVASSAVSFHTVACLLLEQASKSAPLAAASKVALMVVLPPVTNLVTAVPPALVPEMTEVPIPAVLFPAVMVMTSL